MYDMIFTISNCLAKKIGASHEEASLCSMSYENEWRKAEKVFDTLCFWEKEHCKKSYERLFDSNLDHD